MLDILCLPLITIKHSTATDKYVQLPAQASPMASVPAYQIHNVTTTSQWQPGTTRRIFQ